MKVKIKQSIAGLSFSYAAGEVIDMPTTKAKRWVSKGLAEPIVIVKKKVKNVTDNIKSN